MSNLRQPLPIALDVGYGFTKVMMVAEGEVKTSIFQTAVGEVVDVETTDGSKRPPIVKISGKEYYYGQDAINHCRHIITSTSPDWINGDGFAACAAAALGPYLRKAQYGAIIVTGLPVNQYRRDKDILTTKISEIAKRLIPAGQIDVKVFQQPVGTFLSVWDKPALPTEPVAILDVGTGTTDAVAIKGKQVIDNLSGSHNNGVATAAAELIKSVAYEFDMDITIPKAVELLRTSKLMVFGEEKDISLLTTPPLRALASGIQTMAQNLWGKGANFQAMYLTGGGAELIYKHLTAFPHIHLVPNSQMANCEGFLSLAQSFAKKR